MKIHKTTALILGLAGMVSVQKMSAQSYFKVVGYSANWTSAPTATQYSHLTHINYAFLTPNTDGSLQAVPNLSQMQGIVSSGHAKGVKVLISCQATAANWGALAFSSSAVTAFVNNMVNFCYQYNLDGVDIDWEFPNPAPSTSATDYANLMSKLGTAMHNNGKLCTAAVASWGSAASGVLPSVFNSVDWLNIMDYDNNNGVGQSTYASVTTAINYWEGQGLPASKIVMGVPFYGDPNGQYTYTQLLSLGASPYSDSWNGYGYNGIPTIQSKTLLCLQDNIGGMMIWTIGGDATGGNSLLSAMYSTIVPTGRTISLQAQDNNKWVTSNNGTAPLIASAPTPQGWEEFTLVDESSTYGYGYVALQAQANSKYVTAANAGASPLIATAPTASTWEAFFWNPAGSTAVQLRSYINGKWVCADNAGASPLIANRTTPGGWETFNLKLW